MLAQGKDSVVTPGTCRDYVDCRPFTRGLINCKNLKKIKKKVSEEFGLEKKLKIIGIGIVMGNLSVCNYLMVIFMFIFRLNSSCSQKNTGYLFYRRSEIETTAGET